LEGRPPLELLKLGEPESLEGSVEALNVNSEATEAFRQKWGAKVTTTAVSVLAASQLSFAHELAQLLGRPLSVDPLFKMDSSLSSARPREKVIVNPSESAVFLHYPVFQRLEDETPSVSALNVSLPLRSLSPTFAVYSALPQIASEYQVIFGVEPTQRALTEMRRGNERLSGLKISVRNTSNESFEQFMERTGDPFVVIIGHNENGSIRLPNGEDLKLEELARRCVAMATLCFVLACESANFVPQSAVVAVDRPISIGEAVSTTASLIDAADKAVAAQVENRAKFAASATEIIRVFGQDKRAYAVYIQPVGPGGPGIVALNILCGGQPRLDGVPCNAVWEPDITLVKGPTF
jgi:hypothetical protein